MNAHKASVSLTAFLLIGGWGKADIVISERHVRF
jgi:hypothetical protein